MIETKNMIIAACTVEYIDAFMECKHRLEEMLSAYIPDNWPIVLELLPFWQQELHNNTSLAGWLNWIYIDKIERMVIGDGGFKGKPDANGTVEIGYAILPEYRGRGFGTEAAGALIDWAFCQNGVRRIIAHTDADGIASQKVLKKNGFLQAGKINDLAVGELTVWELTRKQYLKFCHNKK